MACSLLSGARKVVLVRTNTPLVLLAIALSPLAVFAACTDAVTADPADSGALPTPTDTTPAPTTTPTGSAPEDAAKPDRAIAPDVPDGERETLRQALLKYCERDTWAMVRLAHWDGSYRTDVARDSARGSD